MGPKSQLKILFIEDLSSDVDLAVLELRKEKLIFEFITVCSRVDLVKALKEFKPDVIISDYMMPSFNGLQALKESKKISPDVPFILCTGSVNEETAVECIKEGAQDYVIKEHITRLPFAVKEALEQVIINNEKRASELLLKENEEKLQSIFSAAPVGIGLVVNRVLIEVNDFFCNMTGYSRKELIGKSSELLYSSADEFITVGEEKYRQISEKGTGSVETKFKSKDGRILNVILSSTPLDKKDHSKGVTFTVLDITDRKRTEDELRETHRSINTLISNLQGIVYRCKNDKQYTMEFLSQGIKELTGYLPEELLNNNEISFNDLIHKDDQEYVWTEIQTSLKRREHYHLTYRLVTKGGEIRWVWEKGEGIFTESGELEFLEGFITDITEHTYAEKALRESEEKYRGIFENVQDVYYETSIDGTILEVSPSIKTLSKGKYNIDDLVGKSMIDFYSEVGDRQGVLDELSSKGTITDFEVSFKNKDGSAAPCSISAKLILDSNGQPKKIIGSMHDITDRKNVTEALKIAKDKAEASDKLKTSFLNNISHEVRTPLNGILGFAEIMSQPNLSDEDKKESLLMLRESSDRLLNTITSYMDISLLTSGSFSVHKRDFSPAKVLTTIYNNFETICAARNLRFLLKISEEAGNLTINSDPEIFQKIISHLLNNAIKFTEHGSIDFGYHVHKNDIVFFVRDTGIGIGKESIEIVFEKFSKEDRGQLKITEGSGLGLSIAKGMTEIIGGRISAQSVLGEGSCFYVSLPVEPNHPLIRPDFPKKDEKTIRHGDLILVAEDDDTNFFYLNALITRETAAKVLRAANGREAIEVYKANPGINLILMDMKMPEIDGFEATRQIKQLNPNVPVLAITAYAMSGDEDRIIAAGCDGYISKPINKKSLINKMSEFIEILPPFQT
jgi:PAS domain S-box-containing protein